MNASAYCSMVPPIGGEGNGTPRWLARCRVSRLHHPPITRASVKTSVHPPVRAYIGRCFVTRGGASLVVCGGASEGVLQRGQVALEGAYGHARQSLRTRSSSTSARPSIPAQGARAGVSDWGLGLGQSHDAHLIQRARSGDVHVVWWKVGCHARGGPCGAPDIM